MLERKIRAALHKRVKALGGEHRALKWMNRRHAPDDFLMLPDRHLWVEGKASDEAARAGQAREHERMRAAGCRVLVINSLEQIDEEFPL